MRLLDARRTHDKMRNIPPAPSSLKSSNNVVETKRLLKAVEEAEKRMNIIKFVCEHTAAKLIEVEEQRKKLDSFSLEALKMGFRLRSKILGVTEDAELIYETLMPHHGTMLYHDGIHASVQDHMKTQSTKFLEEARKISNESQDLLIKCCFLEEELKDLKEKGRALTTEVERLASEVQEHLGTNVEPPPRLPVFFDA